jgi:hypothetical protein
VRVCPCLVAHAAQLVFLDGSYFLGSLDLDDLPYGEGTLCSKLGVERARGSWIHGSLYIGAVDQRGRWDGPGVLFQREGSELRSHWSCGSCVRGSIRFPDASTYVGELQDDAMHGRGDLRLSSGNLYSGNFQRGKKHGLGRQQLSSGGEFEGEFSDDQRHGMGVEWDAEGKIVRCGRWLAGQLNEERPVPIRVLPVGRRLSDNGQLRFQ